MCLYHIFTTFGAPEEKALKNIVEKEKEKYGGIQHIFLFQQCLLPYKRPI